MPKKTKQQKRTTTSASKTGKAKRTKGVKTKVCPHCETRRRVNRFYNDASTKDGLTVWCKPCRKEHAAQTAAANGGRR